MDHSQYMCHVSCRHRSFSDIILTYESYRDITTFFYECSRLAQLVERETVNLEASGSIPLARVKNKAFIQFFLLMRGTLFTSKA